MQHASFTLIGVALLTPPTSALSMLASGPFKPRLTVPPPILSETPGTWAHDTMSRRVREEILGREVFGANKDELQQPEAAEAVAALKALDEELADAANCKIRHLQDDWAPDAAEWRAILDPVVASGGTWLSAPWCTTEFYLYRRVMEALQFYPNPKVAAPTFTFFDPFLKSKQKGLQSALSSLEALAPKVLAVLSTASSLSDDALTTELRLFVLISLWGNRMDLSLWPTGSIGNVADAFAEVLSSGEANLLSDDFMMLAEAATKAKTATTAAAGIKDSDGARVDIIVDNAGFELVTDLLLADFMVTSEIASKVVFQFKSHPTFVSDARASDLRAHVETLAALDPKGPHAGCAALGYRWATHLKSGAWVLEEHAFWVQPSPTWELPSELRESLATSFLAITKGDANYRRLLGDCQWPLDAPFQDVVSYFPTTVCALRTLKAELGCGMAPEQTTRAAELDSAWMVNGHFGVIQVAPPCSFA